MESRERGVWGSLGEFVVGPIATNGLHQVFRRDGGLVGFLKPHFLKEEDMHEGIVFDMWLCDETDDQMALNLEKP